MFAPKFNMESKMKRLFLLAWVFAAALLGQGFEALSEEEAAQIQANRLNEKAREMGLAKKRGFIVGVNLGGGLPYSYSCAGSCGGGNGALSKDSSVFVVGVSGGYQYFFNHYVGVSGYAALDYGSGEGAVSKSGSIPSTSLDAPSQSLLNLSLNADFLAGFAFGEGDHISLGAVAGVGVGVGYLKYEDNFLYGKVGKVGVNLKTGIFVGFLHSHRIEMVAKFLPLKSLNRAESGSPTFSEYFSNVVGTVGYVYAF